VDQFSGGTSILSWITPALGAGNVILDRYWWSTYAYARLHVTREVALELVAPERPYWAALMAPVIFYVTRSTSLKSEELDSQTHGQLDQFYREIIDIQRSQGGEVHEIENDGLLSDTWDRLLRSLSLPNAPLPQD
jgi:thymidylate kinase